ncbi:MAG: glycosyltransferase family 2 protein [Ferruginibacter sp.]|nr:glycosyltransferase family 2 protein [Ferruginibacter sp.]
MDISTIIICKNGSAHLKETLASVQGIGNEIILYDSGSTDDSVKIASSYGANVIYSKWEGYGRNRYKAAMIAKNDWILMIDTDEVINETLKNAILNIDLRNDDIVYKMRYRNFYGKTQIRFGEWGNDSHIRMANRKNVNTDQEIVHEKLFLNPGLKIVTLNGYINHYTVNNCIDYAHKMMEYAWLSADKYHQQDKQASIVKIYFSPLFAFLQNYFFKLGFLDGRKGFICATMTAWYTFLKYTKLKELNKNASPIYKIMDKKCGCF